MSHLFLASIDTLWDNLAYPLSIEDDAAITTFVYQTRLAWLQQRRHPFFWEHILQCGICKCTIARKDKALLAFAREQEMPVLNAEENWEDIDDSDDELETYTPCTSDDDIQGDTNGTSFLKATKNLNDDPSQRPVLCRLLAGIYLENEALAEIEAEHSAWTDYDSDDDEIACAVPSVKIVSQRSPYVPWKWLVVAVVIWSWWHYQETATILKRCLAIAALVVCYAGAVISGIGLTSEDVEDVLG